MHKLGREPDGKFWFVWNPHGRNPTKAHTSSDDAEREAQRLASQNPSEVFVVLEAVSAFRTVAPPTPPVERVDLGAVSDGIPF